MLAFLFVAATAFHVQLESNAASSFPLMKRFGAITIDVYPRGFRAKTIWLRGFALNGEGTITIENPVSRTYTREPVSYLGDIVRFVSTRPISVGTPKGIDITAGNVGKLAARRYRLRYERGDYIDVWTTAALGPTAAYRSCVDELILALSPTSGALLRNIRDTPILVELNIGPYRKLAILRPTSVVFNSAGEAEALRVSKWMIPAPFGTIFK